jgi:AraC-like DNA-binding protein
MKRVLEKKDYFVTGEYPLVVQKMVVSSSVIRHTHQFSELVIVVNGSGVHVVGQQQMKIATGDVFVISGNRTHAYQEINKLELYNILYDVESLSLPASDLSLLPGYHALFSLEPVYRERRGFESKLRLSTDDLLSVCTIIKLLDGELSAKESGYKAMAMSHFLELQVFLSRCYSKESAGNNKELYRIGEAISYLEQQYDKPIILDELAQMAHMSKRNFLRIFADCMNTTPIAHLLNIRLNHAAELLGNSNLTVTEVAYKVGFNDSNYFSRQFRKVKGISPREFMRY